MIKHLLRALTLLAMSSSALAAIEFEGRGQFSTTPTTINYSFDRVCNSDPATNTSGTLYLQMIASPDNDPAGTAQLLSTQDRLGELRGGTCFVNISRTSAYTPPRDGTYYVFLLVYEFPDLNTFLDMSPAVGNPIRFSGGTRDVPSPSTTLTLPLNGSMSGALAPNETDVYQISVTTAGRITLQSGGTLDAVATLRNSAGDIVATDDDSAGGLQFLISLSLVPGDYTLEVRAFDATTSGNYQVTSSFQPQTTTPPPATSTPVSISGNVRYEISGTSVSIEIDEIVNQSNTRTSGTLFITLFATTANTINSTGHDVASFNTSSLPNFSGQLEPGQGLRNVRFTAPLSRPADGTYNMFLVVSEFPEEDTALDFVQFSGTQRFDSPTTLPTGAAGGGGGCSLASDSASPDSGLIGLVIMSVLYLLKRKRLV